MNHAVFCVTPIARPNSCDETPLRSPASIHMAGSHFSRPRGESSKIVPTFTEDCFLQSRHWIIRRVAMVPTFAEPQPFRGQVRPFGKRSFDTNAWARSGSEK